MSFKMFHSGKWKGEVVKKHLQLHRDSFQEIKPSSVLKWYLNDDSPLKILGLLTWDTNTDPIWQTQPRNGFEVYRSTI